MDPFNIDIFRGELKDVVKTRGFKIGILDSVLISSFPKKPASKSKDRTPCQINKHKRMVSKVVFKPGFERLVVEEFGLAMRRKGLGQSVPNELG